MPEEEITPVKRTRAPRKRVASSDAPTERAPRRTVARKAPATRRKPKAETATVEATESVKETATRTRKAPTPLATERTEKSNRKKQLIIAGVVMLFGIGASAAIGFSDAGRIDVNKTIETRNERITSSGDNPTGEVIVPVQNTTGQPNGGMRGRGVGTKNVTPPTENASTTEAAATTTEETTSETNEEATPVDAEVATETTVE